MSLKKKKRSFSNTLFNWCSNSRQRGGVVWNEGGGGGLWRRRKREREGRNLAKEREIQLIKTGEDASKFSQHRSFSTIRFFVLHAQPLVRVPAGSPSRGGDVTVYIWHKPTELAHSFLFCSCVYFCLYGPFNCISFHKFSILLSVFSLCSCGLSSALLVLSTIYLFMKVSFTPDIIPSDWLGSKHKRTN